MKRHFLFVLLGLALLGGLAVGLDYQHRHSETTLRARATQYWNAIQAHDLLTAYHLEAETKAGLLAPDEVETGRIWGVRLISYTLGAVDYFGDKAEIPVTRELTYPDTQMGKTRNKPPIKDIWTFYEGEWYHGLPEKGGSGIRKH